MGGCLRFILKAAGITALLLVATIVGLVMCSPKVEPPTAEQIKRGEHCPRQRNAPTDQIIDIARDSLNFPKTFKREANFGSFSTGRSLVDANGKYQVWVRFSGQNAFGVRSGHVATGEYLKLCVWRSAHAVKTGHLLNRSG